MLLVQQSVEAKGRWFDVWQPLFYYVVATIFAWLSWPRVHVRERSLHSAINDEHANRLVAACD